MSTALALPRSAWKLYIEAARRRSAARTGRKDERLLGRIREAAQMLKTRFGARRVLLFGSLACDIDFRPDSDVDLAVEGLPGAVYWEAWRCAEDLIGERSVDLIDLEAASPSLRPAVISQEHVETLDEFRRFRHVVRHAYAMTFTPDKMAPLITAFPRLGPHLQAELRAFADFLDEMAQAQG